MGHIGFVERFLRLGFVILIMNMDHRTLTQTGQGLVGRLAGIDADPHLVWIRHQALIQPGRLLL